MGIENKHPDYVSMFMEWQKMHDLNEGSKCIKEQTVKYLPPTRSMRMDGMGKDQEGRLAYDAYLLRAHFPEYVSEAVSAYLGLMHKKSATITLPPALEPLRTNATADGESLLSLLFRINLQQLVYGRVGILADLPLTPTTDGSVLPYIAIYRAPTITNWDDGQGQGGQSRLNMVVLNESGFTRENIFDWTYKDRYRVLMLGSDTADETVGLYQVTICEGDIDFAAGNKVTPAYKGRPFNQIPFVFANTKDLETKVSQPPLLKLGEQALTIYRGDADYRQNLFMQGQDTLVIKGSTANGKDPNDEPIRTGAGSVIILDDPQSDAKYIGVNSSGLSEQRLSLENDRKSAESKSGQLASPTSSQVESGDALETRLAAQTSTLTQIAMSGAAALERILKLIAEWIGADPSQVVVDPNLDFANTTAEGQDINFWMSAKANKAPISFQSIHGMLSERGATKMDFQTEMKTMQTELTQYPFLNTVVTPIQDEEPGNE